LGLLALYPAGVCFGGTLGAGKGTAGHAVTA
jgi:hypothetical protein